MERDELTGRTLGEFVLRKRIGEGGFGAVYRAEQPLLGREAVVKILHNRLRSNDLSIQRFLREARLASRLDHPYAAHVYAFGAEPDGIVWIAMELVRGTPLDFWIAERGPLSIDEMVPFFERLAEVVHSVHEHGIVHRDLKPSNVMVTSRAGRLLPKLLDLGIAKLIEESSSPEPADAADPPDAGSGTVDIPGRADVLAPATPGKVSVGKDTPAGGTVEMPGRSDALGPARLSVGTPVPDEEAVTPSLPDAKSPAPLGASPFDLLGKAATLATPVAVVAAPAVAAKLARAEAVAPTIDTGVQDVPAGSPAAQPGMAMGATVMSGPAESALKSGASGPASAALANAASNAGAASGAAAALANAASKSGAASGPGAAASKAGSVAGPAALANAKSGASEASPAPRSSASSLPLVARLTQAGSTIGSPPYMAPEQWLDAWSAGPRADVYSLGILAYECLAGRRPFTASTQLGLLEQHVNGKVPPIGDKFPPALDRFFARALAKQPEQRPATALELAAALRIACGKADDTTALPLLEPAVRDAWLADGPEPIAGAIAVLDAARNAHQARDATWDVVRAVVRYVLAIALATRAQIRGAADAPQLVDLLRAMRTRELTDEERVRMLRLLVRPFSDKRGAYPIPELVDLVAPSKEGERHVIDRLFELRTASDANQRADDLVRSHLSRLLPAVAQFLRATSFVLDYPLVVTTAGDARGVAAERWVGLRRSRRPAAALAAGSANVEPRRALLLDRDGKIVQHLHPIVQVVAPSVGLPDELFFFEGRGRSGALMIATPTGFERHDPSVWEWLGEHVLAEGDDAHVTTEERAPYMGLATFQTDDADRFVGREREVDAFVNRLRGQALQVVVGASGAGKSSFVHAGVVPMLPKTWTVTVMRPGSSPVATLVSRLAANGASANDSDDAMVAVVRKHHRDRETTLLVVIDQLEEIFTACADDAERLRFVTLLARLAGSPDEPVRVVATIRDDFLMKLEALPPLRAQLSASLVLLGNPSVDDLVRTVVEPARRAGYTLSDDDLAHDMAAAVAERPGALALLSFTASQLWELRDRRFKQLTRSAYDAMGGVGGALGKHAETTLDSIRTEDRGLVRDVFCRLVTSEGTRALVSQTELKQVLASPRADAVIEKLVAARLIVVAEGEGGGRVELIHEALIGAWPRYGTWLREDLDGARMRDQLQAAARQWHERKRPNDLLWRGDVLAELERFRRRPIPIAMSDVETAFADASRGDASRTRVRRRVIVGFAFAVLAVAIAILVKLNATAREQKALANENAGKAAASAAESKRRLADQYEEQGRLALLADRSAAALVFFNAALEQDEPTSPALEFMIGRAMGRLAAQRALLRGHTEPINMVDVSPDGALGLTASNDGTVRVWDLSSGAERVVIRPGDPNVFVARWSPTGETIITAGDTGIPRLFSKDGKLLFELKYKLTPSWMTPAFSPDGASVLVPYQDGTLILWDVASGKQLVTATSKLAHPFHSVITPDGKSAIVWGGANFAAEVRDAKTLAFVAKLEGHKRPLQSVAVSPTHVALASRDKTITVWDQKTWQLTYHLSGDTNVVEDVAFDPAGKRLATACRDGTGRIWDVATGDALGYLVGHQTAIRAVRFSRDGTRLITASADGTARMWDAANGTPLATFEGHQRELTGIALAPSSVVTAGLDATARIYPLVPDRKVLGRHAKVPFGMSFSSDGKRLVSGAEGDMQIWDTSTGEAVALTNAVDAKFDPRDPLRLVASYPTELQLLHDQTVTARVNVVADLLGFLPDNRIVFTSPERHTVEIWDPASGAIAKVATHTAWINAIDVADDLVASAGNDHASIWRASTGRTIELPSNEPVSAIAIDPTRKYVVTGSTKAAKVWDAHTGALLRTFATPETTLRIAFDNHGHVLTLGGTEAIAQLWNLEDGTHITTLAGHVRPQIVGVAFLGDDLIATIGDETVRIWEAHSGRPLSIMRTHAIAVATSTYQPALHELATVAYDRTIVLQSVQTPPIDRGKLRDMIRCLPLRLEAGRLIPAPGC